MGVNGTCPRCDSERAMFLAIDSNGNVPVDCSECNFMAAVKFEKAVELIHDNKFPVMLN